MDTWWDITITRLDGSELRLSEQHRSPPREEGEVIERKDAAGELIRAQINSVTQHPPHKGSGLGIFQIIATEILTPKAGKAPE